MWHIINFGGRFGGWIGELHSYPFRIVLFSFVLMCYIFFWYNSEDSTQNMFFLECLFVRHWACGLWYLEDIYNKISSNGGNFLWLREVCDWGMVGFGGLRMGWGYASTVGFLFA